jgi:MGT family glycosyltransferase
MSRFLFLTWNGAGNQPPAVAIAQALEKRGHEITFAGYENQRIYFTERGFRFVLLGRSSATWRDEPPERMFAIKLRAAWASSDHLADVPHLISQEQCDAVVVDCLMFGALAAAEQAHVPTVTLVHSAPGALMPPKGGFESLLLGPVNEMRLQAGLPAIENLWQAWARFPALSNSICQLDPLASQTPESFSYLGPMAEELSPSGWKSPWSMEDRRPVVLVSFSTGPYWDQSSRILRTLDALSSYNCRALVTAGSIELDSSIIPNNAVIVGRIPHDEILPHATVTVTHAGHGTVIASLKHGVPLLCLPNPVADQPILANQIQDLGCGLSLDGENATPSEIRGAIDQLVSERSYAANARLLADTIRQPTGSRLVRD